MLHGQGRRRASAPAARAAARPWRPLASGGLGRGPATPAPPFWERGNKDFHTPPLQQPVLRPRGRRHPCSLLAQRPASFVHRLLCNRGPPHRPPVQGGTLSLHFLPRSACPADGRGRPSCRAPTRRGGSRGRTRRRVRCRAPRPPTRIARSWATASLDRRRFRRRHPSPGRKDRGGAEAPRACTPPLLAPTLSLLPGTAILV